MKQRFNIYPWLMYFLFFSVSCDKDSYINVPEPDDLIVVDGWIENGQFAKVFLTKNSPYFSKIDSAALRSLVLTWAKVTISNGDDSEILILRKNENYFPPYIFEGNEIIGETGKTYSLLAEFGGKSATSFTTIPEQVPIDTAYFRLVDEEKKSGSIFIEFTDPATIKNYYRILTMRVGKDKRYYSTMVMCLDDILFSGEKFGFSISKGPETIFSSNGNQYFELGDTVSIKFCTIDKAHFDFWNSFQDETFNSGNPFASSMQQIQSNIQGDGMGIWGGYGATYHSIIIR